MRNFLEATNTYKQRKTNSFSGKTVISRPLLSGNHFAGNTTHPISVAVLSSRDYTATYFYKASGCKTLSGLIFRISYLPAEPRLSNRVEFISYQYTLEIKSNKYFSYSGALTACCRTHSTNNNIDCINTPESNLIDEKESVYQFTACTLGELPVIPDYLEISLFQRADGIRPARRSPN